MFPVQNEDRERCLGTEEFLNILMFKYKFSLH